MAVEVDAWDGYYSRIAGAEPGDSDFIPYVLPATVGQVIEDFEYGYFHLFNRRPPKKDRERAVYLALRRGEVEYDVRTIVNWESNRCGWRYRPHYFALRLLSEDGRELARATVSYSGQIASYGLTNPDRPYPLLEPEDAERLLAPLGVDEAEGAQLTAVSGPHGRCGRGQPCLVARSGGSIYVIQPSVDGSIWEIPPNASRRTVASFNRQLRREGPNFCCADLESPILSIGFAWAQARRVARLESTSLTVKILANP